MARTYVILAFGLTGCQLQDDAIRSQLRPYIGQPVSVYMMERSRAPSSITPLPGGRLYIFERAGCGTSVRTDDADIIREFNTTCPAGLA